MEMTPKYKQRLGKWGEKVAANYLIEQGHQIIETNYRTPYGEIDLVTQQDDLTIFVEVKTRTTSTYGKPEESITHRKRTHMIKSAEYYIQNHDSINGLWRIDVIAIQRSTRKAIPEITHFKNAIS
jgi:putative endonuclease